MDRSTSFIALAIILAGLLIAGAVVMTRNTAPIREYAQTTPPSSTPDPLLDRLTNRLNQLEQRLATTTSTPTPPPAPTSTSAVPAKKTFSAQGVEISYPANWTVEKRSSSQWSVLDGKKGVGTITCPIPEIGFQAWDVETGSKTRSFTKNGEPMSAELWLATPRKGSENLGWLARLAVGKKDPTDPSHIDVSRGCQAIFDVSNPPTATERATLQEIYQSMK